MDTCLAAVAPKRCCSRRHSLNSSLPFIGAVTRWQDPPSVTAPSCANSSRLPRTCRKAGRRTPLPDATGSSAAATTPCSGTVPDPKAGRSLSIPPRSASSPPRSGRPASKSSRPPTTGPNWKDVNGFFRLVYAKPDYLATLKLSTPVAERVPVDFELRGCPISKSQLIELISAMLAGRKPNIPTHSVCIECKRKGTVCISVARGVPCMGPVTIAGCGALCPEYGRGCFGCFGPMESANTAALTNQFRLLGQGDPEIARSFRSFSAWAWQFRQASEAAEGRGRT